MKVILILDVCNFATNDPEAILQVSVISLMIVTLVSYIPYNVNFRFNNQPDI